MIQRYIWATVLCIGLMSGCAAHRQHQVAIDDLLCKPSDLWLTVASGLIAIACSHSPEHPGMFDCEIVRFDNPNKSHAGLFALRNGPEAGAFDPTDPSNYGSWDECTIHLRDGRSLEEIEVISSGAGLPDDFKRGGGTSNKDLNPTVTPLACARVAPAG